MNFVISISKQQLVLLPLVMTHNTKSGTQLQLKVYYAASKHKITSELVKCRRLIVHYSNL